MIQGLFQDLFNKKKLIVSPYSNEEYAPFINHITGHFIQKQTVVIIASLHCVTCINLITDIQNFIDDEINKIMFLVASTEEVNELERITSSGITIIPIMDSDVINTFRAPGTPYVYILDKKNIIMISSIVDNLEDIKKLISSC